MKIRNTSSFILCGFLFVAIIMFLPQGAEACCSCDREINRSLERNWYEKDRSTVNRVISHIEGEFTTHKLFIVGIMWEDNILPAMMLMTEQLSAVAMQQMQIIGTFFDAKNQLETQQLFQVEQAKIRKNYQPSDGMCEFGTTIKSLAASDMRSEVTSIVLAQRGQERDTGNAYSSGYSGPGADKDSRVYQFAETFCDRNDNNNGLDLLCENVPPLAERLNKDIDFVRTMDSPWTLNVDFTDTDLTHNEEEIMALSSYLYGHQVLMRPPSVTLESDSPDRLTSMQEAYMDSRAITAKRSVARNSFNALAAMKSPGTPGSREFLINILADLGIEQPANNQGIDTLDAIKIMLGDNPDDPVKEEVEPSYNAQMEILTKKLYQNPDFYTNLYDTPANVNRKTVAMQAIGLMQKFDIFKSYLRHEASVSVLLELALMDMQEQIENEIASE